MVRIILASSKEGDVVVDPFRGCGTTVQAAQNLKRDWVGSGGLGQVYYRRFAKLLGRGAIRAQLAT
jgi:DNA modification methylase